MGFKSPIDYNSVHHQIYMAGVEVNSSRNDGYTAWEIKKNIYRIKFLVDAILEKSGKFVDEDEWLQEQEAQKLVFILER